MAGEKPRMTQKQALLVGAAIEALQNAQRATTEAKKRLIVLKGIRTTTKRSSLVTFVNKFPPVIPVPSVECILDSPTKVAGGRPLKKTDIDKITEKNFVKSLRKIERWQIGLGEIFKEIYLKP